MFGLSLRTTRGHLALLVVALRALQNYVCAV